MPVVTIHVPAALRDLAGGRSELRVEAHDVRDAMRRLRDEEPVLSRRVFRDDGEVRGHVNLFLNGRDVRRLSAAECVISADSELSIVPSVAGG